jgi:predicted regulator of Ras-like GTPase activity (Roadblock/LC7/MglB family)
MELLLERDELEKIQSCIKKMSNRSGAQCILLIDRSGQLIASEGNRSEEDMIALAALTAANFGATAAIANILGEKDFSLLFHKGKEENIHFFAFGDDFILISIFDNSTSLGLIRLEVERTTKELLKVISGARDKLKG